MNKLLLVNLAAAWFLTGLSWFLQIVNLPLLARSSKVDWAANRRRNTVLMAPVMTVEFFTAAWLGIFTPTGLNHPNLFHLFLLLVVIWLVTFARYMPLHGRMIRSGDASIFGSLVKWNWVRVICWTARAVLLAAVAASA